MAEKTILDLKIQHQIFELIQGSFALRKGSKRLLVEAKGMMEREVEKNIDENGNG